jgi:hypothetical protein
LAQERADAPAVGRIDANGQVTTLGECRRSAGLGSASYRRAANMTWRISTPRRGPLVARPKDDRVGPIGLLGRVFFFIGQFNRADGNGAATVERLIFDFLNAGTELTLGCQAAGVAAPAERKQQRQQQQRGKQPMAAVRHKGFRLGRRRPILAAA